VQPQQLPNLDDRHSEHGQEREQHRAGDGGEALVAGRSTAG